MCILCNDTMTITVYESKVKPTIMHYMVTKDHTVVHSILFKLKIQYLSGTIVLSNNKWKLLIYSPSHLFLCFSIYYTHIYDILLLMYNC